jgi:MFS family permease
LELSTHFDCCATYSRAMYATATYSNIYVLLMSRFIIGFGSGVLATSRAYVGAVFPSSERMRQYSFLGASKFIGYAITPAIALGLHVNSRPGGLIQTTHTIPGYIMCACCISIAAGCHWGMSDVRAPQKPQNKILTIKAPTTLVQKLHNSIRAVYTTDRSFLIGATVFVVLNAASKGVLTLLEALLAPLFQQTYVDVHGDMQRDTEEFLLYLGLGGLAIYLLMALKPNKPRTPNTTDAPAGYIQTCVNSCARAATRWDMALLIGSQVLTTSGSSILTLDANTLQMSQLVTSAVLIWSIASPVSDTLAVSLF